MHDVFISYSHEDVSIAETICSRLEEARIPCWYASRDIPAGAEREKTIAGALEESRVMVLVYTGHSNDSDEVHRELDAALRNGKTVIPFMCSDTEPSASIKYYISSLHWLNAANAPMDQSVGNLLVLVRRLLSDEDRSRIPDRSSAPAGKPPYWIFGLIAAVIVIAAVMIISGKNRKTDPVSGSTQAEIADTAAEQMPAENESQESAEAAKPAAQTSQESAAAEQQAADAVQESAAAEQPAAETSEEPAAEQPAADVSQKPAAEAETGSSTGAEDYLYSVAENYGSEGIKLDKYIGEEKSEIIIPESIEGQPVVVIGDNCFEDCEYIEQVVLPESLVYIGYRSFYNCTKLAKIDLPESLTGTAGWAFAFTDIAEMELPEEFDYLGYGTFYGCKNLERVALPPKVKDIYWDTFKNTPSLASVTIPNKRVDISSKAFNKDKDVTIIGVSGSYAEYYADCMGMGFEAYGDETGSYVPEEGVYYLYSFVTQDGVKGLVLDVYFGEETSVIEIPETLAGYPVLEIGEKLFSKCDYLEQVILPDSIRAIGNHAFSQCGNLSRINFPKSLTKLGNSALLGTALTEAVISGPLDKLEPYVFYDCKNLTNVVLPKTVTSIGTNTFAGENSLVSVTIPSPEITIDMNAFAKDADLTIIGVKGSNSERYAQKHELKFEEYSN